jgi:signal transduction histidine kinase
MGKKNPVLTVEHSGIKINLIVEDYGIGIPENEVNKVFDSFYRATNTTTLQGTGLGLVVAKQFIELHNGTIELESKLGVGTKVTLTLPINKVD